MKPRDAPALADARPRAKHARRWWLRAAGLAVFVYLALLGAIALGQRSLQYFPDRSAARLDPVVLPGGAAQTLSTPDGESLVAWWIAPRDATRPVFLYLHGNGANLEARAARFAALTADGSGLYAPSWRGYGGSTGTPTEAGLRTDADAAWQALASRVPASRIVVFGESLGTTVAVMLAARERPAALVLDSSFGSALELARDRYPWLPVDWVLRDTYRADEAAPQVRVPVFQVQCREDPLTPLASAERLRSRFAEAAPIEVLDGRCHVPGISRWHATLLRFLDRTGFGP